MGVFVSEICHPDWRGSLGVVPSIFLALGITKVWYGMVWYGMVWYGMEGQPERDALHLTSSGHYQGKVYYGNVWYGMVWKGSLGVVPVHYHIGMGLKGQCQRYIIIWFSGLMSYYYCSTQPKKTISDRQRWH